MSEKGQEALRKAIDQYDTLSSIVGQLEFCDYKDTIGHSIKNSVAFISLKEKAENEVKLFKASSDEAVGYDGYDGFVLLANSLEDALKEVASYSKGDYRGTYTVKEIKLTKENTGLILSSFNAG